MAEIPPTAEEETARLIAVAEDAGCDHSWLVSVSMEAVSPAVRRQIAAEIRAVAADRNRTRPLSADALTATDFANDFEWAARIAEGSL